MPEFNLTVSFPLDAEGFLRRACPSCVREFKWLSADGDESAVTSDEVSCPYCRQPSPGGSWLTTDQQEYIKTAALDEVFEKEVRPALDDLSSSLQQGRSTGGLLSFSTRIDRPTQSQASLVFEPADMRRVDFACHPAQSVKVQEKWEEPVYCIVCGEVSNATP